jgi:protein TonB
MKTRRSGSLLLLAVLPVLAFAQASSTGPVVEARDRVPMHTAVPDYPSAARRDRIEGEVEVCFHVDRKGRPYRVAVRRSSHRVFERAAIRAIRASRYTPLEEDEPVPAIKTCRTFTFSLEPERPQ